MRYELEEYITMSAIQKRVLPDSKVPYIFLYFFNRGKARVERIAVVRYLMSREKEPELEKEAKLCRELVYHGKNPRGVLKKFVRYSIRSRRSSPLNF